MENQAASGHRAADGKAVTVVVPVFNEESHVANLAERLARELSRLSEAWSVLFVDDGSEDGTLTRLREIVRADSRFGALALSRNFGKEAALAAGLRHASGDAIIVMDGDRQHPPEAIPRFVEEWRAGAKVVFGVRQNRVGESAARRGLSKLFYRLFRLVSETPISRDATDFVLFDRQAADALNSLGERCRFSKGLFAWIGFRCATVPFLYGEREGTSSRWSLIKLMGYALDGVASFSSLPLKVWSYVGLAVSTGAIAYAVYFAIQTLVLGVDVPGFPSLIVSITFFAGVQLISLGVLGEYLGRVYQEVKGRPLFVVAERIGAPSAAPNAAAKTES